MIDFKNYVYNSMKPHERIRAAAGVNNTDHVFYAVNGVDGAAARANMIGGLVAYYSPDINEGYGARKTKGHEFGHLFGLLHGTANLFNGKVAREYKFQYKSNDELLKSFNISPFNLMDNSPDGMELNNLQLGNIEVLYKKGLLNKGSNAYDPKHGKDENHDNPPEYQIDYKK